MIKTTDLSEVVKGENVRIIVGVRLNDRKLINLYGQKLLSFIEGCNEEPIDSDISEEESLIPPLISSKTDFRDTFFSKIKKIWYDFYHDYKLKKALKKRNANFVFMQIGDRYICYDFYNIR